MNDAPRPLQRQSPARRRSARRRYPVRRRPLPWRTRLILLAAALAVGSLLWAILARATAPVQNTQRTHFDAIIVLGAPADSEGNPTPSQLERVTEGVREFERGVAPRLILTGGPAHNQYVEARVMAQVAHAQGVPESAIFVEPQARDTIQNACYSARIAREHGWRSAEIISNAEHLPRSALIFNRLKLEWRTHAAPQLAPDSGASRFWTESLETAKTVRYLLYANWADRCEP